MFGWGKPALARERREPQLAPISKDAGSLASPTPSLFWAFGGFPSSTGVPVSPLTAIQSTTVYGCAKARSEDLAKTPLVLRRRSSRGFEVVFDHPIARLLRRPNDWMTPFTFKRFVELSVCYRGNAYVVIQRGPAGDAQSLIPIAPDNVSPHVSSQGTVFYDARHPLLAPNGEAKRLHQDNVLHIKNIGMDAGYIGMSPIAAAQEAVGLALAAQQHGAVLFRQGAQLAGALTHPGSLSIEAKELISRTFTEKFGGVQNAHKVPVLEEGMKFEKLSLTNEEAQFLETRKFQRNEICAIFRVPPHKVMDLERATYSNMEVSEQAYINDALLPDADQIAEEMAAKLLFDDERDELVFAWLWDALLRADRKTRYEAHSIGLNNGFLSVNEVRLEEGRDRIEGGDQYRVPLNIGSASSPNLAPTNTPGDMAPNPARAPEEQPS